jgi:hypothetical protein
MSSHFSPVVGKCFKPAIVLSWATVKYSSLNVAVVDVIVAVGDGIVVAEGIVAPMSVCEPTHLVVVLSAVKSISKDLHTVRVPTNTRINIVATVAAKRKLHESYPSGSPSSSRLVMGQIVVKPGVSDKLDNECVPVLEPKWLWISSVGRRLMSNKHLKLT